MKTRLAALLAVLLLATACGAANDNTDEASAPSEPAATSTATEGQDGEASSSEETVTLAAAAFAATGSAEALVFDTYLDLVEEAAGGAVTFERFYQESLCSGREMAECVRDGRADIGQTIGGYTPNLFPFAELISLPFQSNNAEAIAMAFQDLMGEYPEIEEGLADFGVVNAYHIGVEIGLIGGNEPLNGPADLAGRTVRSSGAGIEAALRAAGAEPVGVTASELYEGLQHGVLDVWLNLLSGAADYNLNEVTSHWYEPGLGVYVNNVALINPDRLASLPPVVQDAFAQATEMFVESGDAYSAYSAGMEDSCTRVLEAGNLEVWEQWDEATVAEWREMTGDGPSDAWKNSVAGLTEDPDAMYDRWLELVETAADESGHVSLAIDCMNRFNAQG
ncbi:MAG TPA: TRAP transporter substrate-binding protein DctP [Egicoccus sp.]|nr:TRAP transporter substrate-binding protein DctP [Egicoccus sp.]HSK24611.1 TRAP transporter substrate-binding protein DctP [Egicoccus sp.]